MPAFASLNDRQMNQLVDYLLSLGAGGTPVPAGPAGVDSGAPMAMSTVPLTITATTTPTSPTMVPSAPEPTLAPTVAATITDTEITTTTTQGPPGPAASIIGSAAHGAKLFARDCVSCHGQQGTGNVSNPGSDDGAVPPLNPIAPELFSADPQHFADNVDRILQHGSVPSGPQPQFNMPAFGDDNTLTQQELADLEAYVLKLNGADRAQLEHPGMPPQRFFLVAVGLFGLLAVGLAAFWLVIRRSPSGLTQGD